MSVSTTTLSFTTTNLLTVLATASATASETSNNREIQLIDNQIQARLAAKTAALQNAPDPAVTAASQAQISGLETQQKMINALQPLYGANANTLNDLQNQLATLQTAASAGNSTSFDNALALANIDVTDLNVVTPTAPFEPDQVTELKGNGLGIASSATYNLSSPAGQAAAVAAVKSAQNLVGQVFQATGSNQILAGDLSTSLMTQINSLNTQQTQAQDSNSTQVDAEIAQLTQQAQDQTHLIELSLGKTQTLATALQEAENPPQPVSSVFGALEEAVGATPSTYSSATNTPAILSLLA